ncbi:glutamate receptor 2.3-like [Neltuma alba]|uniref:glutamate receptor 2.3-like n=1 Tax=Neltuma alba TaxID=207710 RepID=UPI0010A30DE7|nr:glutamate receptor 2.3-like [Prosopis alba]
MMKSISLDATIDKSEFKSDVKTRSLTIEDFGGLFPVACVLAVFFGLSILKPQWLQKKWISCWTFEAIAAIIEAYNWQSVIPIYEEPEFGNDLIPCPSYSLQDMNTRVPYISTIHQNSTDAQIKAEFNEIKGKRTYVLLAHMTVDLWSRLVEYAQNASMMSKGYAWVLTQGLSSTLDPEVMDKTKMGGSTNSALGVRPAVFVHSSIYPHIYYLAIELSKYNQSLSVYGLWTCDTISALACAAENVTYSNGSRVYAANIGMRIETGPELRRAIQDTDFRGLVVDEPAGEFKLTDPTWPGNTKERPTKLKIEVPKTHFTEFVDVTVEGRKISATGFAVDVFKRVVDALPFPLPCEFVPVNNIRGELTPSSYDDLLYNLKKKVSFQSHFGESPDPAAGGTVSS